MTLSGEGGEVVVELDPPVLVMSQRLSVGRTYHRTVSVTNRSQGPTVLRWEEFPDVLYQAVKVIPQTLSLQPMERREVKVEVAPKRVGPLEASLACEVENGSRLAFALYTQVSGPLLKLQEANLDFAADASRGQGEKDSHNHKRMRRNGKVALVTGGGGGD
eukprot:CAMPEP_0169447374 /NCGR_PEP_ID=MMETSP1042-20121227/11486_1 /TAXON_ID=464988 /ORGANISM="Hemiselmis andersenii, Strain CCMP1180" /LENGTH=160 /DNA_ID=CAMNT_0009558927 /DNA_START=14 /DNA_END=492 /DNA_ORIENTATION=-